MKSSVAVLVESLNEFKLVSAEQVAGMTERGELWGWKGYPYLGENKRAQVRYVDAGLWSFKRGRDQPALAFSLLFTPQVFAELRKSEDKRRSTVVRNWAAQHEAEIRKLFEEAEQLVLSEPEFDDDLNLDP